MDIEEFYDADPRRRESPEIELGREWRDTFGVRYELSWVEETGELYVMREPVPSGWADPFGGIHVAGARGVDEAEVEGETVAVLGTVGDRATLEGALEGWERAMRGPDGIEWLADRLRQRGILVAGPVPGDEASSSAGPSAPGTG